MVRFALVLGVGCLLGASVLALDYSDHSAICASVEANTTHAQSLDVEGRLKRCECEVQELQNLLEPQKYEWAMDWKIDAKAFAKNLPEGIKPMEFMSEVTSFGIKAMQACK